LFKTNSLKSKVKILKEINVFNKQLSFFKEAELSKLKFKYENITQNKIIDINKQIDKAASKGKFKFMQDYFYNLKSEILLSNDLTFCW